MTSKKGSLWFGFVVFVFVLALTLAVASVAVAYVDEFGGSATRASAPYTTTDGTGRALDFWPAYEKWVEQYAPYTEQPYAGTDNIGPHVPSNLIKGPSAPFTEPKPFWGQYLER